MCSRRYGNSPPEGLGVYIHIPFCVRKCPYCGFASVATENIQEEPYTEALLKELSMLMEEESLYKSVVDTIYLGGGTPSLLSPSSVETMIDGVLNSLPTSNTPEVSMEVNPGTVDKERLSGFRQAGINRIVIGMQSLSQEGLKTLGRVHTMEDSLEAFHNAIESGFTNIGVDLIYAIPGQTLEGWLEELSKVMRLRPHHISLYELTMEDGTPFERLHLSGSLRMPDEETIVRMYLEGARLLRENGYIHYEISSFAIDGYQCRHNTRYWLSEDYVGLGVGAHSWLKERRRRWQNTEDLDEYMEALATGRLPVTMKRELSRTETLTERLLMGMRLTEGMDMGKIEEEFEVNLRGLPQWGHLMAEGLLEERDDTVRFTERGILLSNEILALLMRS